MSGWQRGFTPDTLATIAILATMAAIAAADGRCRPMPGMSACDVERELQFAASSRCRPTGRCDSVQLPGRRSVPRRRADGTPRVPPAADGAANR